MHTISLNGIVGEDETRRFCGVGRVNEKEHPSLRLPLEIYIYVFGGYMERRVVC